MDNNQFNNINNTEGNASYVDTNITSETPSNSPNDHKKTLSVLLVSCIIGIIILVVIFIGILSPKEEDSSDTNLSPEIEEEHINQVYKAIDTYITATTHAINDMKFGSLTEDGTIYYIPVSTNEEDTCIDLTEGTINPFGDNGLTYVGVVYRSEVYAYDYYFTFYDELGYGLELTEASDISKNIIVKNDKINKNNITTQYAEDTTKIVIFETPKENPNNSCTIK